MRSRSRFHSALMKSIAGLVLLMAGSFVVVQPAQAQKTRREPCISRAADLEEALNWCEYKYALNCRLRKPPEEAYYHSGTSHRWVIRCRPPKAFRFPWDVDIGVGIGNGRDDGDYRRYDRHPRGPRGEPRYDRGERDRRDYNHRDREPRDGRQRERDRGGHDQRD